MYPGMQQEKNNLQLHPGLKNNFILQSRREIRESAKALRIMPPLRTTIQTTKGQIQLHPEMEEGKITSGEKREIACVEGKGKSSYIRG